MGLRRRLCELWTGWVYALPIKYDFFPPVIIILLSMEWTMNIKSSNMRCIAFDFHPIVSFNIRFAKWFNSDVIYIKLASQYSFSLKMFETDIREHFFLFHILRRSHSLSLAAYFFPSGKLHWCFKWIIGSVLK